MTDTAISYVALLRGVNVGGNRKLPMATLRAAAEACGFRSPATYIQSGNLVFTSPRTDRDAVASELGDAIREAVGFAPAIVLSTAAELAAVVTDTPFPADGNLYVVFLDAPPPPPPDIAPYAPEQLAVVGREVYLHLPNGVGRSKLAADVGRWKGYVGTARNWRTVTTLAQLAADAGA